MIEIYQGLQLILLGLGVVNLFLLIVVASVFIYKRLTSCGCD